MRLVVLDFESYFRTKDTEIEPSFTLSKMSTEAYIRDPRFQAHGVAIKWGTDHPARWYDPRQTEWVLKNEDWSDTFVVCHHCQFDGFILSHRYGIHPARLGCTLSMARLVLGNHLSVSLEQVRKHFGMPGKSTSYSLFDGRHWDEITRDVQERIAEGCCDEVESVWKIFHLLMQQGFPAEELRTIDTVLKMFTEPVLKADVDLLATIWEKENNDKQGRLDALGIAAADLASAEKFAALLRAEGIEPETKNGKNEPIYAFAKTDDFMRGLLEHDSERVRTLAEARLGEKSTLMQTRAATLGWMASRGSLAVYLRYAGTGTLRVSGGDGANWLNFKRQSAMRRAIMAPDGFLLAPVDASQIECRVLHYLAGGPTEPVIEKFRNKQDPYVDLASLFYKERIYKPKQGDPRHDEMEAKRGMGKQGRLMCLGPDTIVLTDKGPRPITAVQLNDRLWDGIEWVRHQGLLHQGVRSTINILGNLWLTPDHYVLCGNSWIQASNLRDENTAYLALVSALDNLSYPATKLETAAAWSILWFNVRAVLLNTLLTFGISLQDVLRAAIPALKNRQVFGQKNIMVTQTCVPTRIIGDDCLDESAPSTLVAAAEHRQAGEDMAGAALRFTNHGLKVVKNSWPTWSRFPAGTIQNWNWIEKITIRGIVQVICNLLQKSKIMPIVEPAISLKRKLPTYDLAFAGPRNRFMILSKRGPLIVHNCGYGAAGAQFKATAKNGLYGPPVDISIEDATAFVKLYRDTNPSICGRTGYWAQGEWALSRLAQGVMTEWGPLTIKNKRIYLPSGQPVVYDSLEFYVPESDENCRDFERNGYWRMRTRNGWKKMWGSKIVQNMCEAVSRVIVSQAMNRITSMGYRVLNWPYDELLILILRDGHEEKHAERCAAEMKIAPAWLPNLPLDAEWSLGQRYSK